MTFRNSAVFFTWTYNTAISPNVPTNPRQWFLAPAASEQIPGRQMGSGMVKQRERGGRVWMSELLPQNEVLESHLAGVLTHRICIAFSERTFIARTIFYFSSIWVENYDAFSKGWRDDIPVMWFCRYFMVETALWLGASGWMSDGYRQQKLTFIRKFK